jgi:hypothetical protein
MQNKLFSFLEGCCAHDNKEYSKPFNTGGFVIATQNQYAIAVYGEIEGLERKLNHFTIFEDHADLKKLSFDITKLDSYFQQFLFTYTSRKWVSGEIEMCKTCEGYGEVEHTFKHYKKRFDCPDCDGIGTIGNRIYETTEGLDIDQYDFISFDNTYFGSRFIFKLYQYAKLIGQTTFKISIKDDHSMVATFDDNSKFVIMAGLRESFRIKPEIQFELCE